MLLIIAVVAIFLTVYLMIDSTADTKVQTDTKEVNEDSMELIAHRGASGYAPEHTIEAYKLAKKMNADYIEIDLQITADGNLIAMHDDTVDRTTNGTGPVSDYTLNELKKLDAGSWFNKEYPNKAKEVYTELNVPTLSEIFDQLGTKENYYIEIKESDDSYMEKALLSTLDKYGFLNGDKDHGRIIIQSFSDESLKRIHDLAPKISLTKLQESYETKETTSTVLKEISQYADFIGPSYKYIDREFVISAKKEGLLVHPFTVNETDAMSELEEWGVSGVFTNYLDAYKKIN